MDMIRGDIGLRPIKMNDTDRILRWRNSERVRDNFIYQEDLTREIHNLWIETQVYTGNVYQFIIEHLPSQTPIGTTYIRDIDRFHGKAEFGIYIGEEEYLGKGYASIATDLTTKFAFEELGLNKVFLRVLSDNERAVSSYKRSGFVLEGVFRQDVKLKGVYRDVTFMAIFSVAEEV